LLTSKSKQGGFMSLQEETLVAENTGQYSESGSLLDQIMAQTRIQPESESYDIARQGVTAFIASILQGNHQEEPVNRLAIDSMIAEIDEKNEQSDERNRSFRDISTR